MHFLCISYPWLQLSSKITVMFVNLYAWKMVQILICIEPRCMESNIGRLRLLWPIFHVLCSASTNPTSMQSIILAMHKHLPLSSSSKIPFGTEVSHCVLFNETTNWWFRNAAFIINMLRCLAKDYAMITLYMMSTTKLWWNSFFNATIKLQVSLVHFMLINQFTYFSWIVVTW